MDLILIVDDSLETRVLLKTILEKSGYREILLANSASEAFSLLGIYSKSDEKLQGIDLVLMDILMPEIDGIEATRRIKESDRGRDIPVVMVTGSSDDQDLDQAFQAGASDYIMKPFNRTELLVRIRSTLALKREMDERKERERRLQRDIDLAKSVQLSVLSKPMHDEGISIDALYRPSEGLSGDMYGWYKIRDGCYGIFLCDVMGHGVSASLVSMSIRTLLRDLVTQVIDPIEVMTLLNDHMIRFFSNHKSRNRYCTAFYIVIDLEKKVAEYVNAGHPPGLALVHDNSIMTFEKTVPPLGFVPQLKVLKKTVTLQNVTDILLYTDGVVEEPGKSIIENIEVVKECLKKGNCLESGSFMNEVLLKLNKETSAKDDICLISIRLEDNPMNIIDSFR
ncbi:response regulator [Brevibacillus nitrificans]|uniref:Response regulator n=1 Tax=Brevibacillus nitrificans TaxID=651560 RepID=A0A3M8D5A5_9BACL|nr:fused response regulator/phosphatase [Brevibacillus nitrificans]RNB83232.1 response regulator [Brevibacillus nitrificans]